MTRSFKNIPCLLYSNRFYPHSIGIQSIYHQPCGHQPSLTEQSVVSGCTNTRTDRLCRKKVGHGEKKWVYSFKYLKRLQTGVIEVEETRPANKAVLMFSPPCIPSHCIHALIGTLGNLTVIDSIFL